MADSGLNPDLWTVKAAPHQPVKGVFYTQRFLSKNLALLAVLLRQLYNCQSSFCLIILQRTIELPLSES